MAKDIRIEKLDDRFIIHKDGEAKVYCPTKQALLEYLSNYYTWSPATITPVDPGQMFMSAVGMHTADENAVTKEEEPLKYEPDLSTPQGRIANFFHRFERVEFHGLTLVKDYPQLRIDFLKLLRAHEMEEDHGHKLSHELADRNEEVTKLQKEKRGYQEIIKIKEMELSDLRLLNTKLEKDHKNLHYHHVDKVEHLEKELAELRERKIGCESPTFWQNLVKASQETAANTIRFNEELKTEIESLKAELGETKLKLNDWRREAQNLRATTMAPAHVIIMQRDSEIKVLRDRIIDLEAKVGDFRSYIERELGGDVETYMINGKRVHQKIWQLHQNDIKRIASLQADLKQYEQINSDFARQIQSQVIQIEEWKTKHIELGQELDMMKAANSNWANINHEENMEAGKTIEHLKDRLAKKTLFIEGLQKEIANAKKSIGNLTDTLYGKNLHIQELEKEVKKLREGLSECIDKINDYLLK